jgi:hypothetical protein
VPSAHSASAYHWLLSIVFISRGLNIGRGHWLRVADILFAQKRLADRIQTMDRTRWSGDPVAVAIRRTARLLRLGHAPSLIVQNSSPAAAAIRRINRNASRTKIVVRRFTCWLDGSRQLVGRPKPGGHHQRESQAHYEQDTKANDEGGLSIRHPLGLSPKGQRMIDRISAA